MSEPSTGIPNLSPSSSKWHHWGNSYQKRGPTPGAPWPHIEIAWEASSKSGYFCDKRWERASHVDQQIKRLQMNLKASFFVNTLEVLEDLFMKGIPGTTDTVFLILQVKSVCLSSVFYFDPSFHVWSFLSMLSLLLKSSTIKLNEWMNLP